MANTLQLIVFPVSDLDKAKTFYGTYLGTEPYVDGAYYVGYKVGELEIGLDPNSTLGPIVYTSVADIKTALAAMITAGGEVVKEPTNVGGGLMIAQVKDTSGSVVGFRQTA